MKKILFVFAMLGISFASNAQELFGSATNSSIDGYITGGYIKRGWGLYGGYQYKEENPINQKTGTLAGNTKFGIIRMFASEKMMMGLGIQRDTRDNTKNAPNVWVGWAPLKSEGLKIWLIANYNGDKIAPCLGITYKLSQINF